MPDIYLARGTGNVHGFDVPLSQPIWEQYVSGGLYEVDADGNRLPEPTPNRPLSRQPEQHADAAAWREYAVTTHGLSADEAAKLTQDELSRRFHLNPDMTPV